MKRNQNYTEDIKVPRINHKLLSSTMEQIASIKNRQSIFYQPVKVRLGKQVRTGVEVQVSVSDHKRLPAGLRPVRRNELWGRKLFTFVAIKATESTRRLAKGMGKRAKSVMLVEV